MKKTNSNKKGCGCGFICFICIIIFIISMCSNPSEENKNTQTTIAPTPAITQTSAPTPQPAEAQPIIEETEPETAPIYDNSSLTSDEEMVWVGDTGTKYHYQSCSTLKGNGHQITLQQALNEGRQPCQRCH